MNIYASKHYKKLLVVPIIALVFVFVYAPQVRLGIQFVGGTTISVSIKPDFNPDELATYLLSEFNLVDLTVRKTSGLNPVAYIEFAGEATLLQAQSLLEAGKYKEVIQLLKPVVELNQTGDEKTIAENYFSTVRRDFKNTLTAALAGRGLEIQSYDDIGPSLGLMFLGEARNALIFSMILVVILMFVFFKTPFVSLAATQSAVYDFLFGFAALGFFGIPLSLATLASLLLLIGFSVDTDIMLTDRVLKRREGEPSERTLGALHTGLLMTGTTIGALACIFIISWFANIEILLSISLILIVGLIGDLIATWFTNTALLLWYMEKKGIKYE